MYPVSDCMSVHMTGDIESVVSARLYHLVSIVSDLYRPTRFKDV